MAGLVATVQPALQPLANFALPTIEQTQLGRYPPINFLYGHFHNSIREELGLLQVRVQSLEASGDGNVVAVLKQLHDRYKFLEQVYKYHSTVEDEVRGGRSLPGRVGGYLVAYVQPIPAQPSGALPRA